MKNKKNSLGVRLIQLFAAITIPLLSVLFAGDTMPRKMYWLRYPDPIRIWSTPI